MNNNIIVINQQPKSSSNLKDHFMYLNKKTMFIDQHRTVDGLQMVCHQSRDKFINKADLVVCFQKNAWFLNYHDTMTELIKLLMVHISDQGCLVLSTKGQCGCRISYKNVETDALYQLFDD